jgi:hypothetical protein
LKVYINETNIDKFDLTKVTGETREFLLNEAAKAAKAGLDLSVELPDDLVLEHNVFDHYDGEPVDPRRLNVCNYEKKEIEGGGEVWICMVHGKTSQYDVAADSHVPCIQVQPTREAVPDVDTIEEAFQTMDTPCVYTKADDAIDGTTWVCAVHGKPSKFDIGRLPNMPCLAIEPAYPGENSDPHRP